MVKAHDQLAYNTIDIVAKNVVNCTGPWIYDLLYSCQVKHKKEDKAFAIGVNIVTKPIFRSNIAVAVRNHQSRNSRAYFVVPWRKKSIVGTYWYNYHGENNDFQVTEHLCHKLIDSFNSAYPSAQLRLQDVLHIHSGLVPCRKSTALPPNDVSLLKHYQIINHDQDGINGLFSVMGVKYTTAGDVARKILRQVVPTREHKPVSLQPRLIGGEIDDFNKFKLEILNKYGQKIDKDTLLNLTLNYGSEASKVIDLSHSVTSRWLSRRLSPLDVVKGETLFAVRHEMAQKLTDVVFRRTDRGTAGSPSKSELDTISQYMKKELGWTESRRLAELDEIKDSYPDFLPSTSS